MRARTSVPVVPPSLVTRRSSTTRSSAPWPACDSRVTASRYNVPWPASSNRPGRAIVASVNAPRSWPNSSASTRVSGRAGQSTVINGSRLRGPEACRKRARASLPTPVSPVMRTVASTAA